MEQGADITATVWLAWAGVISGAGICALWWGLRWVWRGLEEMKRSKEAEVKERGEE